MLGGIERASRFDRQKDNMKIKTRDVGLLAVGFVAGAIITASLTSTPKRPVTTPTTRVVATGPLLAAASLPPALATNFVIQLPPLRSVMPQASGGLGVQSPLYPPPRPSVDLIDTRYQPDIKLDDMK